MSDEGMYSIYLMSSTTAYTYAMLITISLFSSVCGYGLGRDWKWRPPPRGYTLDSYNLCESYVENAVCHYGNQCVDAHGNEELHEWKERFEYRKMRVQRACEKELYGKSYTEQLLDKLVGLRHQSMY